MRVVHQASRERDLGALSLGKALRAPVREIANLEQADDVLDALVNRICGKATERCELARKFDGSLHIVHVPQGSAADRVMVLDFGKQISLGTPAEVQADPNVQAAYLGTSTGA